MHIFILLILLSLFFSGCTNDMSVPIEYNYNKSTQEKNSQGKNRHYSGKTVAHIDDEEIISKPLELDDMEEETGKLNNEDGEEELNEVKSLNQDNFKIIYHEVAENEGIAEIARKYNQDITDIEKLNDMKAGDEVEEFQIIKVKIPIILLNQENQLLNQDEDLDTEELLIKKNPLDKIRKYIKPVEGKIISKFGETVENQKTKGVIISAKKDSEIKSIADGTIIYADKDVKFGNLVIIKLDNQDVYIAYAYMQDLIIKKGTKVRQSKVIGHVGMSGNAKKPQLYFAIREGKIAVDPEKYVSYKEE